MDQQSDWPLGLCEKDRFNILFFSRGHGRGHVIPDLAIAERLLNQYPDVKLRFVSYAGAIEVLQASGRDPIDLRLPDSPPLFDLMTRQIRLIAHIQPGLVIAHEEFLAIPAAHAFGIPSILLTDFFQEPTSLITIAASYAKEVLFTGEPGVFTEPPQLRGKVQYVGPAIRRFDYNRSDRLRARQELGLPADATVLLCQPGNWPESQVPISDLLFKAWDALRITPRRLIWLAWRDYDLLCSKYQGREDVILFRKREDMGRLFAASDLVITKANRLTVFESAALGIRSISISAGVNWPDDVAIAHVESNTPLMLSGLEPSHLARVITERLESGSVPDEKLPRWDGVGGATRRIAMHLDYLRNGTGRPVAEG